MSTLAVYASGHHHLKQISKIDAQVSAGLSDHEPISLCWRRASLCLRPRGRRFRHRCLPDIWRAQYDSKVRTSKPHSEISFNINIDSNHSSPANSGLSFVTGRIQSTLSGSSLDRPIRSRTTDHRYHINITSVPGDYLY